MADNGACRSERPRCLPPGCSAVCERRLSDGRSARKTRTIIAVSAAERAATITGWSTHDMTGDIEAHDDVSAPECTWREARLGVPWSRRLPPPFRTRALGHRAIGHSGAARRRGGGRHLGDACPQRLSAAAGPARSTTCGSWPAASPTRYRSRRLTSRTTRISRSITGCASLAPDNCRDARTLCRGPYGELRE
jgi:hypothetical protein